MILCFADDDFNNLAILAKELLFSQLLEQLILGDGRRIDASDIDEILLNNPEAGQMLSAKSIGFALLGLLCLRRC